MSLAVVPANGAVLAVVTIADDLEAARLWATPCTAGLPP
jgi:hypothetical protein